jgi:tRNA A22 N-methylase
MALTTNPEIVWDIGCDHGYLGLSIQDHLPNIQLHLVDQSRAVIDRLKNRLEETNKLNQKVEVHCLNGAHIPLSNHSKELIIMAGIGGHNALRVLGEIKGKYWPWQFKLLLAIHRDIPLCRETLSSWGGCNERRILLRERTINYSLELWRFV